MMFLGSSLPWEVGLASRRNLGALCIPGIEWGATSTPDANGGASCWRDDGCVMVEGGGDHSEGPSPFLSSQESKPLWEITAAQCRSQPCCQRQL